LKPNVYSTSRPVLRIFFNNTDAWRAREHEPIIGVWSLDTRVSGVVVKRFRAERSEVRIPAMPLFYLGQAVYSHCLSSLLSSNKLGYKREYVFGLDRFNGLTDWQDIYYPGINVRGCESHGRSPVSHMGEARGPKDRRRGWGSWGANRRFLGRGSEPPPRGSEPPPHQLRGLGERCNCKLPQKGPGGAPENLKFVATWDLKSHSRNIMKCSE